MSTFDSIIARGLAQSLKHGMGDTVVLNGTEMKAVINLSHLGSERGSRGGRRSSITGSVALSKDDWNLAQGKQGDSIVTPDGVARISSEPTLTAGVIRFSIEGRGA